jgi:2-oxoglutarate dehydrogenase E2 component (dihydrolipoamide succinyltransferase)
MAVELTVPQLGESIVEATVGHWLKAEGAQVAEGETLVELETDKVNVEVAAPAAGVLARILKPEGETVAIGDVLAVVAPASEAPAAPPTAQPGGASTASATSAPAVSAFGQPAEAPATVSATAREDGAAHAAPVVTPVARRMAEEHGVDLTRIGGTGAAGRITQDDVSAYLKAQSQPQPQPQPSPALAARSSSMPAAPVSPPAANVASPAPAAPVAPAAPPAAPAPSAAGRTEERVRMSRRRQTIARRLVEAQHTAAMLTTFNEVDMSAILELRARRREAFKQAHGVSLGFMSFFTKGVIGALKAYPRLNAEIQGDEMILKRYYDIGIAVSTDEGLVVPVLRDADRLTFAQIEQGIAELAQKARNRTLSLEDLQGGTFTITNGGVFGSLLSTPILNAPQVGILGMHKIEERPIALNGQVVIHPMMYLAVSYDHRIVDGAEAVSFLVRLKELLEDPEKLLLEA